MIMRNLCDVQTWEIIKHKLRIIISAHFSRRFIKDSKRYSSMCDSGSAFIIDKKSLYPVLHDAVKSAGNVDEHYFLQDIYMARKIVEDGPSKHYDIGSRIDGFIGHLLAANGIIKEVIMLDIRPFPVSVSGLYFQQADATDLNGIEDDSIMSISSLHAIEHFGLGRYGDEIDPEGWRKALQSIQAKIARGGRFYFSVPIGPKDKLCFNAHRIFAPSTVIKTLDKMTLVSFAYLHNMQITEKKLDNIENINDGIMEYDLGLFIFEK